MKKLASLLLTLCSFLTVTAQQDFVVQSIHSQGANSVAYDENRNLLITYGYQDKTLKFWDESSGLLYRTADLEGYNNDFEIDKKNGKTYLLINNKVVIYDNTTFKKVKEYPLGRIYALDFLETQEFSYVTLFAQDTEGKQSLYALDENTGEFLPANNIPPFTGEGEINHFEFNKDNSFIFITTDRLYSYVYSYQTQQYYEIRDYALAMLENGDIITGAYEDEGKRAVYSRINPITKAVVWKQELKIDINVESIVPTPYRTDVIINSDEKSLWVSPGTSLFVELDAKAGYIMGKIYREEQKLAGLAVGDYFYAQSGIDKPFAKFRRYENKPVLTYGHNVVNPNNIVVYYGASEADIIFSANYGEHTYSLLANPNVTRFTNYKTNYRDDYSDGRLVVDQKSNKVFSVTNTSDPIKVFKRGKPNSFKDLVNNIKEVEHFDNNESSNILATLGKSGLRIINTEEGREVFSKVIGLDMQFADRGLALSPVNNTLAYITREMTGSSYTNEQLHYFDYVTNQELWNKKGKYSALQFIKNGSQLVMANNTTSTLELLDPQTGNVLRSFPLNFGKSTLESTISPDEKYIIFSGFEAKLYVFEIDTGKLVTSYINQAFKYSPGTFVSNEIVAISDASAIKFFNVLNNKEVLRIYIFTDGDWIAYTPEGLFDGSPSAWDKVAFVKNREVIPLESVFSSFYTPRLLHKILFNGKVEKREDIKDLKAPPSVTITYKEGSRNLTVEDDVQSSKVITTQNQNGEITLNGNANGDRIIEMRLFQNGKLVSANTRNLIVEDDLPSGNSKSYKVKLAEGSNEFIAVAINSQGTESRPDKLTVIYKPVKSEFTPQGLQAHILVIGIDKYKNSKYDLNYAVADATSFKESVMKGVKNITSKVNIYEIKNDEAVRDNILSKLTEVASKANPQDIFVFYYAGHGVVAQEGDKDFYLVPYDVTQLYGNDGALKQKGISAKELKQIASSIPAQKQLYILDACQSAGALSTIAARGAIEEKAIAQLARSTGTHWLTASGSEQFATEFDELGHGVFTYALLEALSGKADSGDKRITVNEIKAYIESRVPEISEKYKGSPQYPSSFGFGQDFPLGIQN